MELCRSGLPGRRVYKATTADDELPPGEVADELHRRPSLKITGPVAETAKLFRRLTAASPADEDFHNVPSIERQCLMNRNGNTPSPAERDGASV